MIGQKQLTTFREAMQEKADDPWHVLLNRNNLPLSLIGHSEKTAKMHILETETFGDVFGPKAQRKKPKLSVESVDQLVSNAGELQGRCALSYSELGS
jgi:nuclear GTP-binding protein